MRPSESIRKYGWLIAIAGIIIMLPFILPCDENKGRFHVVFRRPLPFIEGIHGGGEFVGKIGCEKFSGIIGRDPYFVTVKNWDGIVFVNSRHSKVNKYQKETIINIYSFKTKTVTSVSLGLLLINGPRSASDNASDVGVFESEYINGNKIRIIDEDKHWHINAIIDMTENRVDKIDRVWAGKVNGNQ